MKIKIGSKLHSIRENRKLSQAEMADLLNIPASSYARYERGDSSVELDKLVSFAEALGVQVTELLPETLQMNNNNSGQGGFIIFGSHSTTNYYYYDKDSTIQQKDEQIKLLEERLKRLEELLSKSEGNKDK